MKAIDQPPGDWHSKIQADEPSAAVWPRFTGNDRSQRTITHGETSIDLNEVTVLVITPTDLDVLRRLAQGKPLPEIADYVGIDAGEIEAYVTSLCSTMGVSGPAEAVMRASQRGLLAPDLRLE